MSGKIFINYRRGDDPGNTGRLFDQLAQEFPSDQLFMDVEGGIPPGDDFVQVLETQVAQCDVMLSLIGQGWLTATDETGARRLENPDDFVRIEIETAMRLGKRVIPVLVNKAEMPRATQLPAPMQPLVRRNAVRLTHERFKTDVQGLITALQDALHRAEAARQAASTAAAEAKQRELEEQAARAEETARAEKERKRLEAIAGLSPEQIAKAEELANWEFIKTSANVHDLRDHLARFPGGVTERFARARLEDLVWEGLGAAATLQQLDNFIAEFPQGAHAKAAADRRATLGQEETANREEREQRARETEAWAAASRSGDAAALAAFLDEWPRSTYADTAGARIRALARPPTRRGLLGLGAAAGVAVGGGVIWSLQPRRRLIRSLVEPSHTPHSVVFSRDGRTVLSGGGGDTTLALWDVDTGKKLRTFAGHSLTVASVALSHDGRVALSGSWDHTLKLWEVTTGKELHTFEGHTVTITSVALSPDGLVALSGSWDHTLKLWELATGKKLRTFAGHRYGVSSVALSLGGFIALSGSLDHTLKLWEVATAKELRTFIGHSGAVNSVAFSGDGRTALSGSEDTTLKLWEVATGKELRTFTGHSGSVYSVAFSPDGRIALSGSGDKTLKLWEVANGKNRHTFTRDVGVIRAVALSPDGRTALSAEDDVINLWDLTGL